MLEKSGARLLKNCHVRSVSEDETRPYSKNLIIYRDEFGNEIRDNSFDYVVIAFPIYKQTKDEFLINFKCCSVNSNVLYPFIIIMFYFYFISDFGLILLLELAMFIQNTQYI